MKIMKMREKVSKLVVVTMASALVISSMFTDKGFSTHANETVDSDLPEFESVSGGDYVVAVAEPIPLYNYAAPTDNFEKPDLTDPFLYGVYANTMSQSTHVESNVAIGAAGPSQWWRLEIWGGSQAVGFTGVSYIGDLSVGELVFQKGGTNCYLVIPETNESGTANKLTLPDSRYSFHRITVDNTEENSFIAGTDLRGFAYQNNIKSVIADTLRAKAAWAEELYKLPDMDTDAAYVLNVDSANLGSECWSKIVTSARDEGKTVIINVTSGGDVTIPQPGGEGDYVDWAGRILWNCSKANKVSVQDRVYGFILAPNATVTNNSNIIGNVMANDFAQNGEVHQVHWIGRIPEPPAEPTPEPTATPEPSAEPTPTPGPEPTVTPEPSAEPTPTPGPEPTATPEPPAEPTPTPGPEPTATPEPPAEPTPTPGPEPTATPEPPTEPTPEPPTEPTPPPTVPTPPPSVTEPPQVTQPPQVTDPPTTPEDPDTPELDTPTPVVPLTPETPVVNGMRRTRTVRIDDDEIPLSDAMVLGARRRPQTGDESDAWTLMFMASLSALAAWILKGVKK